MNVASLCSERAARWLVLALALFFALTFHTGTWESGDEDRYYTLGQALHRGWGFVNAEQPEHAPEIITPPGYPALIAAAMSVFGEDAQRIKWTGGLYLAVSLLVIHALCRRLWPGQPLPGLATFLLGTCSVSLLAFSGALMADLPGLLLAYLALWLHLRAPAPPSVRTALLVGFIAGLAYLCRAAAVALIGALALDLLVRRAWRPLLALFAGCALAAAPWWYRNAVLLHVPDQYITYAVPAGTGLPGLLQLLVAETVRDLPVFLHQLGGEHFYRLFGDGGLLDRLGLGGCSDPVRWSFLTVVAAGWLVRLRRPGVLEYFFPAHLLLISAYPRPFYDTNYLFPVLPLSAYYFVSAVVAAGDAWARRRPAPLARRLPAMLYAGAAAYALLTALLAGLVHGRNEWRMRAFGPWDAARYRQIGGTDYEDWIRYVEAGGWIRSNTPPTTLVASRKPKHTFVFADRRGWRYDLPHEVGCTNAWEAMIKYPQVVFIEDGFATSRTTFNAYGNARVNVLQPLMETHRAELELLHETAAPTTRVWRVRPAAAPPAAAAPAPQ